MATGHIMQNLDSWPVYIAYALGFTAGNVVGVVYPEYCLYSLIFDTMCVVFPIDG